MITNHTSDCTYKENLHFDMFISDKETFFIRDTGLRFVRKCGKNDHYADNYSVFKFCPICGTKYDE